MSYLEPDLFIEDLYESVMRLFVEVVEDIKIELLSDDRVTTSGGVLES